MNEYTNIINNMYYDVWTKVYPKFNDEIINKIELLRIDINQIVHHQLWIFIHDELNDIPSKEFEYEQ